MIILTTVRLISTIHIFNSIAYIQTFLPVAAVALIYAVVVTGGSTVSIVILTTGQINGIEHE